MISPRKNSYKTVCVALFNLSLLFSFSNNFAASQSQALEKETQLNLLSESELEQTTQETVKQETEENRPTPVAKEQMPDDNPNVDDPNAPEPVRPQKIIKNIYITGNRLVDKQAILNKIPYKVDEPFDPRKTRRLIHNLYYGLKRIKNIKLVGELVDNDGINLHIAVEEKTVLKDIEFLPKKRTVGNDEFKKKINLTDIPALDEQELKRYEVIIKTILAAKNFHQARVKSELKIDTDGRATAIFHIEEGQKSVVKRVSFEGNKHIGGKELRKLIFTREDWILGFLDSAGSLQQDRLEGDKHIIEQYYQSNGYLKAKVVKADVQMDEESKNFNVVFHIDEGDLYTISEITASGNDILKDEYLVARVPIKSGDLYSRKKIMDAIKNLEMIWGDLGYIFAHIEPSIEPNDDTKTVKLAFYTELGDKVFLNKINIIGNKKTKDKVIRRKLLLREGDLITTRKQEMSKYGVESLGYFDPKDGANWKITRLDKNLANLDLIVKEVKTGHAGIKLGLGGSVESITAANSSFSVSGEINDTNLFGSGISLSLNATLAKGEQTFVFNITDPWLFDQPLTGAFDLYHKRPTYSELRNVGPVHEKTTGGGVTLGFISPRLNNSQVMFKLGADQVRYEKRPVVSLLMQNCLTSAEKIYLRPQYQNMIDKLFTGGTYLWFETQIGQDRRNHPMHTSRGYKWYANSKFGIPSLHCNVGFYKLDVDFAWYTPLIGVNDLVLKFHTFMGYNKKFKNKTIPYRELYHIGGPASVRGFLFGQVSPMFCGDSIGASKAFFTNLELHFPITQDFNIKGVVFYDGGTGWDNPYTDCCPNNIEKNTFNYRHAVGFGFRMMNPVPVRVDWGFKLDRRKRWDETPYEVHFGMTYDW